MSGSALSRWRGSPRRRSQRDPRRRLHPARPRWRPFGRSPSSPGPSLAVVRSPPAAREISTLALTLAGKAPEIRAAPPARHHREAECGDGRSADSPAIPGVLRGRISLAASGFRLGRDGVLTGTAIRNRSQRANTVEVTRGRQFERLVSDALRTRWNRYYPSSQPGLRTVEPRVDERAVFTAVMFLLTSNSTCCRQHPPHLSCTRAGPRSRAFDAPARLRGTDPQKICQ